MKKFIVIAIVLIPVISFAVRIPNNLGVDWRTDAPIGKNWVKVSDIHHLNKNSIKKVKGTIYQATLCNPVNVPGKSSASAWNYFKVRVDCKSKQAYMDNDGAWLGPMEPTSLDEAAMKYACK
ncbi:MAG: hypothetical protein A2X80_11230 [Geobacteraceae bacterium GWB2_52_12]|nr:MAG: hypothetical protein A2X80_11230 [Geobacteraceae bacterium GWB2_52_12]